MATTSNNKRVTRTEVRSERTTSPLRVLGRLRLSKSTEESTSIERQREIIQQWANANEHTVVGGAKDIDVSGAVDPFDTPQLGEWLNHRFPEWDILCAWKLDRLGRKAVQLNRLFGWCGEHDKTVVSCSESIDLGSWAGRMLASVIAGLAEGELEAIQERQRGSRRKLRETARWAGGNPRSDTRLCNATTVRAGRWGSTRWQVRCYGFVEPMTGIEPAYSAWEADPMCPRVSL